MGQLQSINQCHISKKVLTMADIIAGNGIDLRRDAHMHVVSLCVPSRYKWAKESPSLEDWHLWQHALLLRLRMAPYHFLII